MTSVYSQETIRAEGWYELPVVSSWLVIMSHHEWEIRAE